MPTLHSLGIAKAPRGESVQGDSLLATSDFGDGVYNGFSVYNNRLYFNCMESAFTKYGYCSMGIGLVWITFIIVQISCGFVGTILFLSLSMPVVCLYFFAFGKTTRIVFDMTSGTISFGLGAEKVVDAYKCPPEFRKDDFTINGNITYILSLCVSGEKFTLISKNRNEANQKITFAIYDFLIDLIETSLKQKMTLRETANEIIKNQPELGETLRFLPRSVLLRVAVSLCALIGYLVILSAAALTVDLICIYFF